LGNSLPSLSSGELAFNEINRTLYYGASSYSVGISAIPIGGDGAFTTYTYIQSITSTFGNSSALNALSAEVKNLSTDVAIISAEVKSLSAEADNKFLLKSGGKITGNLTIYGDLSATGTSYFANTIYTTTSALSIININNTGPALYVANNGTGDLASFYDLDTNTEVFHIGGANGSFPNIGVKTSTPNKDFTVNGEISASGNIWTSGNFISAGKELMSIIYPDINLGVSSYTTVRSNSANWNASYTNLVTNSAAYLSGSDLSFLSVSGNWNSVYTSTRDNSGSWNSVYNTVNPLSSSWNSVYNTVNPLSSNWNSVYTNVNVNSGSYATINYTDSKFFPISGGNITGATKIQGNLTVYGDLSATGNSYFFNTVYSTTSALSVINIGNTGPALYVGNNGTGDIASFYDIDSNLEVFHIGGANGTFPNVGVKTSTPNVDFTVNGEISANNTIYDISGNSNQWNSVYNTVISNSAINWNYQGTDLKDLSANWVGGNIAFTNLISNSAAYLSGSDLSFLSVSGNWNSVYTSVKDTSANWDDAYTNLVANSASYLSGYDLSFLSVSANWNSVYDTVNTLSANWDSVYTSVKDTSANWDSVYTSVKDTSGSWDSVYSSVNSVSSKWDSVYDDVNTLSANWDSVYTSVKDTSGSWDSVYTSVNVNSANWDSVYTNVSSYSATYATYDYVNTNFLNLTGGIIDGSLSVLSSFEVGNGDTVLFVSGGKVGINTELPSVELTVSGSISASNKIYGTIIDWMTLTRGYKTVPTFNSTIVGGDVYTYVYESSPSDKTYYRYIATDGSEDAYYETFSGGILSNVIAKKEIII
jgi:uncharacterized protein YoxC